jgi:tetratricopeptide (TPR) repeat protein
MAKPARAAEYARRSLASYQPSDAPSVFEQSRVPSHLANLALAAIERGEIEGARRELAQLKAFAERDGRPELRIRHQLSASSLEVAAGNSEDALRFAAEYATDRDLVSIAVSLDVVASALLLAGRPRDAAAKLEELRRRAQELAFELQVPKALAGLALAHLAMGELDRAEAFATEGLTLSRQRGTLRFEPPNLIALARVRIAKRGGDARNEAEDLLAQAEARANAEGGPRIHLPAIAEARAQLAAAMGDARRQRELLGDAHRLYTEMGATGHAARLAKELGL